MPNTFNIIKFKGDPNSVTLYDGTVIQNPKDDFVFVPEYEAMVRKAGYGNHFLFEVPKRIKAPSFMCSCGSAAVFVGSKSYLHLNSAEGLMLVCQHHLEYNKHVDGSS